MTQRFFKSALFSALTAAAVALPFSTASAIDARIEAGVLTCEVEAGSGLIIGSSKDMACEFVAVDEHRETYLGNIKKFGIDIGSTEKTTISWLVFAPTTEMEAGALEGKYAGFSAEASVGVGLGANALIGGLDKSIALQPFSGQVQEGFNIAAGIGAMTLRNP